MSMLRGWVAAAPQVPAADAAAGTSGGSLTIKATPQAPTVAIATKVANEQMLLACLLVHNGAFDQGKGAVFFSRTMAITMEKSQTLGGPTDSFRSNASLQGVLCGGRKGRHERAGRAPICFRGDRPESFDLSDALPDLNHSYQVRIVFGVEYAAF